MFPFGATGLFLGQTVSFRECIFFNLIYIDTLAKTELDCLVQQIGRCTELICFDSHDPHQIANVYVLSNVLLDMVNLRFKPAYLVDVRFG